MRFLIALGVTLSPFVAWWVTTRIIFRDGELDLPEKVGFSLVAWLFLWMGVVLLIGLAALWRWAL